MKNRIALLVTILLATGLWSFAQVAPQPQPKPEPKPQPAPVQPAQPAQAGEPAITPVPPADIVEIRIDDAAGNDFIRRGQYDRALAAQLAQTAQVQAGQAAAAAHEAFFYKQKTEKGSYIGLGTSPIPTVLRDQLKLPNGSGLVVDRIEPNSPAETAGMKVSDIIQKLDDQVLINPHQFGVLVRNLKPDTEVKLAIIRQTQPQTVAIKAVEKDLAPLDEAAAYGTPRPWRDTQVANNANFGGGAGFYTVKNKPDKFGGENFFNTTDRAEMVTDNGTTRISTTVDNKGDRRVNVVEKATGKVIYDGPMNTDEQRQALPKEVQDQIKDLEKMQLKAGFGARALPTPRGTLNLDGRTVRIGGKQNNLPKPKSVSGSDDDYTWEFTTKTDEAGKPELELLLLDKNGKILFQGPFSRTRDIKTLPAPMVDRLSTSPWDMVIEDLKSTGGGNGKGAMIGAPGGLPGGGDNFTPPPPAPKNRLAK